eukprot:TRINITY_DN14322_c0_g1_i1.p1 TRINITY_DN14322_c0_g1~~TRINITY_DN14322_c0_g1_i1.p1  ORF type:complete len:289 (-),score=28.00 TRINITY_DN14322_c0_g1_i1:312-1178(-)
MKKLNVYLVRHAESRNNSKNQHDTSSRIQHEPSELRPVSTRESDPALTSRGEAQAEAAAQLLRRITEDEATDRSLKPKRIFVSGFKRALETCAPIATALNIQPELRLDLHEEGGIFEGSRRSSAAELAALPKRHGLTAEGMREVIPSLSGTDVVPIEGWWRGGRETPEEAVSRAQQCAKWLWQLAEDAEPGDGEDGEEEAQAVICVSHGLYMDKLIKALAGLPPGLSSALFLTSNCGYWMIQLRVDHNADNPRVAVLAASNVVDHIPMAIRTGHTMGGVSHCQPSYFP